MKKATTTRMRSQVCSLRKAKTWLAALKMKFTIEPMKPGCCLTSLSFWLITLVPFFVAKAIEPRMTPTAMKKASRVQPYFLKTSLTLSSRGLSLSRTSSSALILSSSASFSATRASAAARLLGEVFSSFVFRDFVIELFRFLFKLVQRFEGFFLRSKQTQVLVNLPLFAHKLFDFCL